jgi:hypothetical protein
MYIRSFGNCLAAAACPPENSQGGRGDQGQHRKHAGRFTEMYAVKRTQRHTAHVLPTRDP